MTDPLNIIIVVSVLGMICGGAILYLLRRGKVR